MTEREELINAMTEELMGKMDAQSGLMEDEK